MRRRSRRPQRARPGARGWNRPADIETAAILARHAMPLIGIVALGWSPLEVIYSLFLDSLSVLARAAGAAAYFTTRSLAHDEQDWADRINLIGGGVAIFLIVLGLCAFTLAVFAFFIWGYVLRSLDVDVWQLLTDRSLALVFAAMLVCQLPGFVQFVRTHDDASARTVVGPEVGFVLQRLAVITMLCGFVAILPGPLALGAALVIIQLVLAGFEIMRRGGRIRL